MANDWWSDAQYSMLDSRCSMLGARRRRTEDGRQKTPGRETEQPAPGVNSRADRR